MRDSHGSSGVNDGGIVGTPPDLGRSPVARYLQLATLFRNHILSGRWAVGSKIPNVEALARECGVARETIRQALGLLERENLIERLRAKGTFVRRTPSAGVPHKMSIDWASVITAHEGADVEVLTEGIVDRLPDLEHDGVVAPSYHMMRRRHVRGGVPYLVATLYLDERLGSEEIFDRLRTEPTFLVLQDILGDRLGRARQVLTIGSADVELASQLNLAINAPIGEVTRVVLDRDGTLVYAGFGKYRGDTLRLEIDLR